MWRKITTFSSSHVKANDGLFRRSIFSVVIAVLGSFVMTAAETSESDTGLRDELRTVERLIAGHFDALPMRMIGRVRGGHLEEFGAVFLLELNVVPMANVSPFRQPYSEAERKNLNQKKRLGIDQLEQMGPVLLQKAAESLDAIPLEEDIALIIALFYFTWEDTTGLPSQLVLQAPRKMLLDAMAGNIDEVGFKRAVKTRRF